MKWQEYIERDPQVLVGKPVIKGTRIAVELILERLGDGWTEAELRTSFPSLRPEHIRAAQAYAAAALKIQPMLPEETSSHNSEGRVDDRSSPLCVFGDGWRAQRKKLAAAGLLILGTQRKSPRVLEPPAGPGPAGVLDALLDQRRHGR